MRNIKTYLVSIMAIASFSCLQAATWGSWTSVIGGVTTGSQLVPVSQTAPLATRPLPNIYFYTCEHLQNVRLYAEINYLTPPTIGNDRAEATVNGKLTLNGVNKGQKQAGIDKFAWSDKIMTQTQTFSGYGDLLTCWGVLSAQGRLFSSVRVDLTW